MKETCISSLNTARPVRVCLSHLVSGDEGTNNGMKVRDAIKQIELDGWRLARTRGSHRQYHHPTKPGTVTIAGKPSLDLDPKTEHSILRQAGLS